MAELKTKKNETSVTEFLNQVPQATKREDAFEILNMMERITGEKPKMWGASIVGFGDYHYKYASGREGDWFICGFSPRKASFSLYLMNCDLSQASHLLENLGKHKAGKGCLYINKLADVNKEVLKKLIRETIKACKKEKTNVTDS